MATDTEYYYLSDTEKLADMHGKTAIAVGRGVDWLTLTFDDGSRYEFEHEQSCCECFYLEDVCGDLGDLLGTPLLGAEVVSSDDEPGPGAESYTWSFYKLWTATGCVTLRFLGTSSGYYSETVDIKRTSPEVES